MFYMVVFMTWLALTFAFSLAVCIVTVMALWSFITKGCVC